jgi:hypothetical protein
MAAYLLGKGAAPQLTGTLTSIINCINTVYFLSL